MFIKHQKDKIIHGFTWTQQLEYYHGTSIANFIFSIHLQDPDLFLEVEDEWFPDLVAHAPCYILGFTQQWSKLLEE